MNDLYKPKVVRGIESRKEDDVLMQALMEKGLMQMLWDNTDIRNLLDEAHELIEQGKRYAIECERLRKERDKLIEGLRWYGDSETYEGNVEWDDDGTIICTEWPPINVDNGQRARNILKEIGVTVEWQRSANDMRTTR